MPRSFVIHAQGFRCGRRRSLFDGRRGGCPSSPVPCCKRLGNFWKSHMATRGEHTSIYQYITTVVHAPALIFILGLIERCIKGNVLVTKATPHRLRHRTPWEWQRKRRVTCLRLLIGRYACRMQSELYSVAAVEIYQNCRRDFNARLRCVH